MVNSRSHLTFRYTDYTNETQGRPDNIASVSATTAIGTRLDLGRLDQVGLLTVPVPVAGQTAFNDFVQPLIDRYGYVENGVKVGGGTVGYGTTFDEDNFFRKAGQIGYNIDFGGALKHDLHVGYQRYLDAEDLIRSSNGWGSITVPGGRLSFNGTPIFYTAAFQQQGLGLVPKIHSEYQSQSFEANDTDPLARLDLQRRHRRQQRHAVRAGPAEGLVEAADRLRGEAGGEVRDVRHPVQQDDPAAPGHDLGLQRPRHGVRQLRHLQPGRELAAARGVLGSQPGDDHQLALRRQRRAVRVDQRGVVVGQAVRRGHDAADHRRS